ncbi:MAG: TonB-dependent receptor [Flavobacteriaceae bacterium]|nr:TonB-dependent receptor [Flavobacteriaceae bacterium]
MKIKIFIICALLVQAVFSQKVITGTVVSNDNMPLLGASIIIKNTTKGTQSDFDGNFTLEASEGDVLVVSYVGFTTQEVTINSNNKYNIVLLEDLTQLDEVVVVGYGTQKKTILTSSVAQVKGDALQKESVTNITQALQGKAAGVQVVASDAPGVASTVIIRGLGTIQGGRNPLYVVDGVLTDNINNINSADITSMNVLKDAASLAIYGNRGANGVIMITTKQGKDGKMKLSFDTFTGFRDILSDVKMANASQFVIYSNEALQRDLRRDDNPSNDNDTSGFFSSDQPYNTNWLDQITRTGRITNYNLSLSGGSEKIQSFFSAGFTEEEGILKDHDFNRLTLRNNLNYKISNNLKFSHNISAQLASANPQSFNLFTMAYKQSPIVPLRDENGKFGSSVAFNNVGNPGIGGTFFEEKQKWLRLQASFKLDYKVIDPLTFTSRFSIDAEYGRFRRFDDRLGAFLAANPANSESNFEGGIDNPAKTRLKVTHTNNYRWFLDNYFTFTKSINELHNFKATLGLTAEENSGEYLTGTRNNVPSDTNLLFNLNNGDEDNTQLSGGALSIKDRLYSYIARVNYDYDNKYLLNASFRRDGSSKFQKGNRFGNFFAVSAGWVLSKESFMADSLFDLLKLRASYGELGNQNVAFNVLTARTGSGGFYAFGSGQDLQQGITITGTVQEDLSWETTNEFNIGLEYALFDNKLKGEFDYYNRTNTNATLQLQLPDVFGFDPFNAHVGEVSNKGIELSVNWADTINKDWNYTVGGNFSYNKNELTKVLSPYFNEQRGGFIDNGQYTKKIAEGQPLGSFFLYEVAGIDDQGEFIYVDHNNNGVTDEGDRRFFGSYIPKYYFNFNFGVNYRNFDLTVDTFGNFGNEVYNGKKAQRFGNENIEADVFNNRWTSGRPSNTGPIASNNVPLSSNYYLESGDFFRVNNITLGYTLPEDILKHFTKVRVYVSAKNPLIFKKFSGFTPELSGNDNGNPLGTAGIELNAYPTLKSFYIGINTSF